MSKTTIILGALASIGIASVANAAGPSAPASAGLSPLSGLPVVSDAAKAKILKSQEMQIAKRKRPFTRAFVEENGPTFAQYIQSLKHGEDTENLGPVADVREVFETVRTLG
jgi:hypothetical protein